MKQLIKKYKQLKISDEGNLCSYSVKRQCTIYIDSMNIDIPHKIDDVIFQLQNKINTTVDFLKEPGDWNIKKGNFFFLKID